MRIERVQHPGWLSNTWIVAEPDGDHAVIVDAGAPAGPVIERVRALGLQVDYLLNTHHHHDHVAENARLVEETGARLAAHALEAPRIRGVEVQLQDGDVLRAGALSIEVLHIPGHTEGQAAFLVGGRLCCTGDTLFRGSVGSTTAPGHTTFADLRCSLLRLLSLADDVEVAPGHSDPTTIGKERVQNPFLRVLRGAEPEGTASARFDGQEVRLVVWAPDYDGGHKAWVRFEDGQEATVPGSRVLRAV